MSEKAWGIFETDTEVHVIPLNDKMEHIKCIDCQCKPDYERYDKLLVIHNAFDFREIMECLRDDIGR